jgi:hypothetical protein
MFIFEFHALGHSAPGCAASELPQLRWVAHDGHRFLGGGANASARCGEAP